MISDKDLLELKEQENKNSLNEQNNKIEKLDFYEKSTTHIYYVEIDLNGKNIEIIISEYSTRNLTSIDFDYRSSEDLTDEENDILNDYVESYEFME